MGRKITGWARAFALRPLASVCLAFALTVTLCACLLAGWQMLLMMAAALFLGLVCCLRRHFLLSGLFLATFLGAMLGWSRLYHINYLELAWAGQEAELTIRLESYPRQERWSYQAEGSVVTEGGLEGERLLLWLEEPLQEAKPGDLLTGSFSLSSARGEGVWELSSFSRDFVLSAESRDIDWEAQETPWSLLPKVWAKDLERDLLALLPEEEAGLLLSLALGEKSALSEELRHDLERTGLSHIVAASGLHVHMISYALWLLPGDRRRKGLLLLPLLILYGALAGSTPSISRAVLMQSLFLLAVALEREADGATSLALALVLILLRNPTAIADAGLQLSFAAMAGILFLSPRLEKRTLDWGKLEGLRQSICVTLGANAFTLPLVLHYFGSASVLGLLSNLLVLWLLPVLLPGALLLGFAHWTALGGLLSSLTGGLIGLIRVLARFPWAVLDGEHPQFLFWLALSYGLGALVLFRKPKKGRVLRSGAVSVAALLLAFGSVGWVYDSSPMTLTMLDVGQGQCILLTTPEETAVIDCGSQKEESDLLLTRELDLARREKIDLLLLTHYDSDHTSGVLDLLRERRVGELLLPLPTPEEAPLLPPLLAEAKSQGTEITFLPEKTVRPFGAGRLEVYLTHSEGERGLALLASLGEWDALVMGDADLAAEARLLAEEQLPKLEVLCAGHHGSANATGDGLLYTTKPKEVFLSVGENSYGHPAEEMLERCGKWGIPVRRTDREGRLTARWEEKSRDK